MRILSVVWFKVLPPKYGGQKGTALFNKYLSAHTELTCLCSKSNSSAEDLPYKMLPFLPDSKLQFFNPVCWYQIINEAKKTRAAVLILEYPYHAIAGVLAQKILGIKFVLHQHNIEYLRFKTLGNWWWRLLYWYERWACRKADYIFFKTGADLHTAVTAFQLPSEKCSVVPYGVEASENKISSENIRLKHNITADEKIILFAGTLDYEPNAEAVKNIYTKVVPALEASLKLFKILICGRLKQKDFFYLKNFRHPNILFIGEVETIEPYFAAADVFINPVLYSGGVQTKILDALSFHVSVVTFRQTVPDSITSVAAGKIIAVENNNWAAFANAIQKTMTEKKQTPDSFFKKFDWNCIAANAWDTLKLFQNPITSR